MPPEVPHPATPGPGGFLLTSVGKGAGMVVHLRAAVERCAATRGRPVWAGSSDPFPAAAAFADGRLRLPLAADPEFVEVLAEACQRRGITVVIPLADHDLARLAPESARLAAAGIRLACPPPEIVSLCGDKQAFAAWAGEEGLPHPRTVPAGEAPALGFPVFLKPRHGSGSAGAGVCPDAATLASRAVPEDAWIAQEIVPGPEFTVDAHLDRDGRPTVCVPRIRERVVAGQSFVSRTVRDPGVSDLALRTLGRLAARGLRGPVNVQVLRGPEPVLLEVNPRLGSGSVLSDQATGGRLLGHLVAESAGLAVEGDPGDYEAGLTMTRFVGEVFHRDGRDVVCRLP